MDYNGLIIEPAENGCVITALRVDGARIVNISSNDKTTLKTVATVLKKFNTEPIAPTPPPEPTHEEETEEISL